MQEKDQQLEQIAKTFAEQLDIDAYQALINADKEYKNYLAGKEKKKRRIAFFTLAGSLVGAYIFDRVAVAIGLIPEELLFGNIVRNFWHRFFG